MKYVTLAEIAKQISVDEAEFLRWEMEGLLPEKGVITIPNGEKRYAPTTILNSWKEGVEPSTPSKEENEKNYQEVVEALPSFRELCLKDVGVVSGVGLGIRELHPVYLKWHKEALPKSVKPLRQKCLAQALSEIGLEREEDTKLHKKVYRVELVG